MVSQGAQTNGVLINGRKLMKSYSEATGRFGNANYNGDPRTIDSIIDYHEPLHRTQSDEPPRSPYMAVSPPPFPQETTPCPASDSSSVTKSDHDSEESESKKEIFIDFKPISFGPKTGKKPLMKTSSDGEILMDQRKALRVDDGELQKKTPISMSHNNIALDEDQSPRTFSPYFKNEPIRHEGIFKDLGEHVFSSIDESIEGNPLLNQDSIDEEFHENYFYRGVYAKDGSSVSDQEFDRCIPPKISEESSPGDECIVPNLCLLPDRKLSPFASSDSLANDIR